MTLYNLKTGPLDGQFRITKFDSDLNVSSTYLLTQTECECPQGIKPTCRHRKMLPLLIDRVDTPWFWHFEQAQWQDPTGAAEFDVIKDAIYGEDCAEGARVTPEAGDAVALRGEFHEPKVYAGAITDRLPEPVLSLNERAEIVIPAAKPEPLGEAPLIRRRL